MPLTHMINPSLGQDQDLQLMSLLSLLACWCASREAEETRLIAQAVGDRGILVCLTTEGVQKTGIGPRSYETPWQQEGVHQTPSMCLNCTPCRFASMTDKAFKRAAHAAQALCRQASQARGIDKSMPLRK